MSAESEAMTEMHRDHTCAWCESEIKPNVEGARGHVFTWQRRDANGQIDLRRYCTYHCMTTDFDSETRAYK